ncbi:MAG TPA: DUF1549 and DUF1553 domain-containing protein [Planctomycetota bacterium]|nr:DUF1549 and DUF1553 domain-containing protein [Planctomycetota bacterium]
MTALLILLLAQARAPEILERHCLPCHNDRTHKGDLDLSTRLAIKTKPEALWRSVAHLDEPYMPHKAPKLPAADLEEIRRWIDAGMKYERPLKSTAAKEVHWAFAPLRNGSLEPLSQGEPADPRVLARRLAFDLTGLPPDPPDLPYEQQVDQLLASPRYGERWARHWLDVARYADSGGYESDLDRKSIYAYRDAVIRSFNDDLPFDLFAQWQVSGDQAAPDNPLALALTGFVACGPASDTTPTDTRRNKEKYRMDELDDIVSTTSQAFLGLTVGCARCHDHKYDPISSREYYQLVAVFRSTRREEKPLSPAHRRLQEYLAPRRAALRDVLVSQLPIPAAEKDILRQPLHANNAISAGLYKKHGDSVQPTDERLRATLALQDLARWDELAKDVQGAAPTALTVADGEPEKTWLLGRGDVDLKTEEVRPGFFQVLDTGRERDPRPRVALGQWLTDVDRGAGRLLARVIVNRLWQHHFGEGLVATANDFGAQGDRPANVELLDGLAQALIQGGWKLKSLQRLIVLSRLYRSKRAPLRLEAEALRDAILGVSGRLNLAMYGPAVKVRIPAEAIVTRSKDDYPRTIQDGPDQWRRSIYVFLKRSVALPFLEVHDAPSASASCGRRARTTVAPQALTLLNDPFVRDCAKAFAARAGNAETAFRLALGRPPSAQELETASRLDLVDLCHVLFTLNEFAYVD